jgi:hypothetical protein
MTVQPCGPSFTTKVAGVVDPLGRKMRAGDQQCLAGGDDLFAHIRFAQRHVGTVFAVEQQREGLAVLEAQQTMAVRRSGSVLMPLTSQPSRASDSTRKRPMWSSPTRLSMADLSPSRAVPKAILADEPPRYLAKLLTSSRRAPPVVRRGRRPSARGKSNPVVDHWQIESGPCWLLLFLSACVAPDGDKRIWCERTLELLFVAINIFSIIFYTEILFH